MMESSARSKFKKKKFIVALTRQYNRTQSPQSIRLNCSTRIQQTNFKLTMTSKSELWFTVCQLCILVTKFLKLKLKL